MEFGRRNRREPVCENAAGRRAVRKREMSHGVIAAIKYTFAVDDGEVIFHGFIIASLLKRVVQVARAAERNFAADLLGAECISGMDFARTEAKIDFVGGGADGATTIDC